MSIPSLPLFPDAYFGDTKHLTCEQHGAYLQLLMLAWKSRGCAIPDNDALIARMISLRLNRWLAIKGVVMAFWDLGDDGLWRQKRLVEEFQFVTSRIEARRAAGKLGGRPKSLKTNGSGKAKGYSGQKQNETKPKAPNPNPIKKEREAIASPQKASEKASPLPNDFLPNEADLACAETVGIRGQEFAGLIDHWRDHHTAKGSLFVDWHAALRTWIRRTPTMKPNGGTNGTARRRTVTDVAREDIARMLSERDRTDLLGSEGWSSGVGDLGAVPAKRH